MPINLRKTTSSPEQTSHRPLTRRERHFQESLRRLRAHPAVTSAPQLPPNHTQSTLSNEEQLPSNIIQKLFNDLVRRELGVNSKNKTDSTSEINTHLNQHLATTRAVAEKPTLSQPAFLRQLSTGHSTADLADRKLIAGVVEKPIDAPFCVPNAHQVHIAIQNAKNEKNIDQKSKSNSLTNNDQLCKDNNTPQETQIMTRRRSRRTSLIDANSDLGSSERKKRRRSLRLEQKDSSTDFLNSQTSSLPDNSNHVGRVTRSSRVKVNVASGPQSECCFCPPPNLFNGKELQSELIGPFVDLQGRARLFVHFDCACWAPQVYAESGTGQLKRVFDEYNRGRQLKCNDCGQRGATIGCYVQRCKKVFHFRCLQRAGACRVERFFVAFCENHAHLSKKRSYKILMEAATIADVAAAQRREDTTFGLDAPHSRYTCLRRRETEVIFSRRWGICSHPGVYDNETVVFSHRKKIVLGKHDALRASDRIKAIRKSVLDIASGKLAYASVAGKNMNEGPSSATEARAALNSRENTSLLLLRNLQKAPIWTKETIHYIKRLPMTENTGGNNEESVKDSARPDEEQDTLDAHIDLSTETNPAAKVSAENPDEQAVNPELNTEITKATEKVNSKQDEIITNDRGIEMAANRKHATADAGKGSINDDNPCIDKPAGKTDNENITTEPSAPLPSFRKSFRRPRRGHLSDGPTSIAQAEDIGGGDEDFKSKKTDEKIQREISARDSDSDSNKMEIIKDETAAIPTEKPSSPLTTNGTVPRKRRSAWELFLEEQLPKERKLRPNDSEADAMRNMARLWSLMSTKEREEYEKLAKHEYEISDTGWSFKEIVGNGIERATYVSHQSRGKGSSAVTATRNATNVGFFRQRKQTTNERKSSKPANTNESSRGARHSVSVPLPRTRHAGRLRNGKSRDMEDRNMDWEKMFPTDINAASFDDCSEDDQTGIRESRRVRKPPRRNPTYD